MVEALAHLKPGWCMELCCFGCGLHMPSEEMVQALAYSPARQPSISNKAENDRILVTAHNSNNGINIQNPSRDGEQPIEPAD